MCALQKNLWVTTKYSKDTKGTFGAMCEWLELSKTGASGEAVGWRPEVVGLKWIQVALVFTFRGKMCVSVCVLSIGRSTIRLFDELGRMHVSVRPSCGILICEGSFGTRRRKSLLDLWKRPVGFGKGRFGGTGARPANALFPLGSGATLGFAGDRCNLLHTSYHT